MRKIIFKRNDGTISKKVEDYVIEYLADLVIMGAFVFTLVR